MMKLIFLLLFPLFFLNASSQDTTFMYYDEEWKPTSISNARYVSKIFNEGKLWRQMDYWISTGKLQSDGYFLDKKLKKKTGIWTWFSETGIIESKRVYEKNEQKEHIVYHANGKPNVHAFFEGDEIIKVDGWDELGNKIPNSIYQKEAEFPGGLQMWAAYLKKEILQNGPMNYKLGNIEGTVVVAFRIDPEGYITDVKIDQSSGFKELDEHALTIIRSGPKWIPAVQYNKRVVYRQRQSIRYESLD